MGVWEYIRKHRTTLIIGLVLLLACLLWAGVAILRPLPPRTLTMATGPEGSAYHEFGKRYQQILARSGVKLRLRPTAGAIENLALLKEPGTKVDVGFLQSGTTSGKESPGLESLGTVFYEPVWFFYRDVFQGAGQGKTVLTLKETLRGKKIAIGPEGSGTRYLALRLLARNGIDQRFAELLPLDPGKSSEMLARGEISAAIMLASWDDPVVQRLLTEDGVKLVSYPRADAYVALYPFLNKVVLPEGAADLAKDEPPANMNLIAPKASLVVRSDLHTALQYLLLDAADQIHSGPGIFQKAGQFPAAEAIDLPLSDEAREFYKSGKPFFQRHLPFWLAVLLDRLLVILIPLVGIVYPLVKALPGLYDSSMRKRIYRLYGELRFMEQDLAARGPDQDRGDLKERLDGLEEKANRLKLPMTYASMVYTLRDHIVVVQRRLEKQ